MERTDIHIATDSVAKDAERRSVVALVAIAAIVPSLLLMAPAVATQLAIELQLGPAQIGKLFSVELGAMSLASLPAWYWLPRLDWRRAALGGALVFIVANLVSALTVDFGQLLMLRAISGLAGGSLMVLCMSSASTTAEPDRVYGFWVVGQLLSGTLGLALLPALFERFGLGAFFIALALIMSACVPFSRWLPAGKTQVEHSSGSRSLSLLALCGIAAVLLFYTSLNGVWTFAGALGKDAGIAGETSSWILTVASMFGVAGAFSATLLGRRFGRSAPMFGGYALMIGCILLLLGSPTSLRFGLAALGFKYAWTFVVPFMMASLAGIDSTGRLMSLINLVIGGGLALGPLLAGQLIEAGQGFQALLLASAVLASGSLLLMMGLQANRWK